MEENLESLSTASSVLPVEILERGDGSPARDARDDGVKALLGLISTIVDSANPENISSLIASVGQAQGVLAFLQNEAIGVGRDHPLFKKALLEGTEMATVFALNYQDLDPPGVIWVSLYEVNPEKGGISILGGRERSLLADLNGDGDRVNITTIVFEMPEDIDAELNYLGMWGSENGDDLIEAGEVKSPLPLKGRTNLSLPPGGLRLKGRVNEG